MRKVCINVQDSITSKLFKTRFRVRRRNNDETYRGQRDKSDYFRASVEVAIALRTMQNPNACLAQNFEPLMVGFNRPFCYALRFYKVCCCERLSSVVHDPLCY